MEESNYYFSNLCFKLVYRNNSSVNRYLKNNRYYCLKKPHQGKIVLNQITVSLILGRAYDGIPIYLPS